jgi:D-aminopeptidase
VIEAPIALTSTLNVGLVADGLVQYAVRESPEIGIRTSTVNVVVGECNDSFLNDIQGRHVRSEHVWAALENAAEGPVAEGAVGAGVGTGCFGWKGGIGTASRLLPPEVGGFVVGALVQSNFGLPRNLAICGVPVGRYIQPPEANRSPGQERGSIMIVLATDAPLDAGNCGGVRPGGGRQLGSATTARQRTSSSRSASFWIPRAANLTSKSFRPRGAGMLFPRSSSVEGDPQLPSPRKP